MKKIILVTAFLLCIACWRGVYTAHYENYHQHSVDQVFRDYNGYRVVWANERGELKEISYKGVPSLDVSYSDCAILPVDLSNSMKYRFKLFSGYNIRSSAVKIVKDLSANRRGFADVLTAKVKHQINNFKPRHALDYRIVVIHLPNKQGLNPGRYSHGHVADRQEGEMSEIK